MPSQTFYVTSTTAVTSVTTAANLVGAPNDTVATATSTSGSGTFITGIFTILSIPNNATITSVKVGIRTAKTGGSNGGVNSVQTLQTATLVETFTTDATTTGSLTDYEFTTTDPRWLTVATLKLLRLRWNTSATTGVNKTSTADAMWIKVTYTNAGPENYATVVESSSNAGSSTNALGSPDGAVSDISSPGAAFLRCSFNLLDLTSVPTPIKFGARWVPAGNQTYGYTQFNVYLGTDTTPVETFTPTGDLSVMRTDEYTSTRTWTLAELQAVQVEVKASGGGISSRQTTVDSLWVSAVAAVASRAKRWNGSAWVDAPMKRWSGSAWVDATVKRWNGSAWV